MKAMFDKVPWCPDMFWEEGYIRLFPLPIDNKKWLNILICFSVHFIVILDCKTKQKNPAILQLTVILKLFTKSSIVLLND